MSAEAWAGYSFVVSLIALVVAIKSYVQVESIKALNLRVKLTSSFNELNLLRRGIEERVDLGNNSRKAVLRISRPGGAEVAWDREVERDKGELQRILDRCPVDRGGHDKVSVRELESLWGDVDRAIVELKALESKYVKVLGDDDKFRFARNERMQRER